MGARYSIGVTAAATFLTILMRGALSMLAAVSRGAVDMALSRFFDALISIPSKMSALVVIAVLASSVPVLIGMVAVIYTSGAFRIWRALAVDVNALDFVEVARARGEGTGEYVGRMEDVLDFYAEAPDPKRPVICFDESPIQVIGEVRQPVPTRYGQIERYDCEYRRNGTANLFVFLDVHRSWRWVKVTKRRAAKDFAACMRELTEVDCPKAERIHVVLDKLSTHRLARSIRVSRLVKHDECCAD